MNLSINLTLGSPVADSASNSVVAAEDMSDQGFSLRLADELNERELAPLMLPDAKKADDSALLEQIATRQQIAADAETFADKDGRVWLEDPLAGLPDAEATDDETIETFAGDKPWLDIIEKAHNYSTVLQANKTDSRSVAEMVVVESTAAAVDPKQDLTLSDVAMLAADQASEAERAHSQLVAVADEVKAESKTAATSGLIAGSSKIDAGSALVISPSPAVGPSVSADVGATQVAFTEAESPELNAEGLLLQPVANESATKMVNAAVMEPTSETTVTGALGQKDPDRAPQVPSNSGVTTPQSAERVPVKAQHEVVVTDVQSKQTDLPAVDVMHKTSAERSDKQTVKTTVEPALSAAEQTAMQQETERLTAGQQTAAVTAMQAGTVTANRPSGTQTNGTEKAPAANAFAVHLRAVNQTQQQQQQPQSGAEQQPGQGQAKANIEVMALNPSGPVVTTVPAFAQQLQQITETTPVAGSVGHTVAHSAAITTGNTTLLSARPAETPGWQPPLALTEPAAAQQIKDRVMVQIQHKLQTAEVQLHPEELGSMQIKLNLQQDQLSVQFVVQQGAAKEALEQQMPKLRELLEQQGIALSEGQVEQRQSGSQQEQHTHRQGTNTGAESEIAAVQTVQMKVSDRMVDFYA